MSPKLQPNKHAKHAFPEECVFVSAFTAVGANKYLYLQGSDLEHIDLKHLNPLYFGRAGDGDIVARFKVPDNEKEKFLPPQNTLELIEKGEILSIPVKDNDGKTKGLFLLQRIKEDPHDTLVPFNTINGKDKITGRRITFDTDIATFIINSNARFIDPGPDKPADPTPQERLKFLEVLNELFLNAIKAKHPETYDHVINMTWLAKKLAEEIGENNPNFRISPQNLEIFGLLASLHDIGKYQVPNALLDHPNLKEEGTLSEKATVRKHAADSRDIIDVPIVGSKYSLLPSEVDRTLPIIVSAHHMSPNGSGYPYNTADESLTNDGRLSFRGNIFPSYKKVRAGEAPDKLKLPFEANLLQVCDVFEALTAVRKHRGYKLNPSDALAKMAKDIDSNGSTIGAIAEDINPYIFYFFSQSKTLKKYCFDRKRSHLGEGPNPLNAIREQLEEGKEYAKIRILSEQYKAETVMSLFEPRKAVEDEQSTTHHRSNVGPPGNRGSLPEH